RLHVLYPFVEYGLAQPDIASEVMETLHGRYLIRFNTLSWPIPWCKPRGSVSDNLSHKWLIKKGHRRSPEQCRRFCSCRFPQNPQGSTTAIYKLLILKGVPGVDPLVPNQILRLVEVCRD